MSKATELARGRLNGADELVILLNQPDLEPPLVLVRWPAAPSVSSLQSFPTLASKAAKVYGTSSLEVLSEGQEPVRMSRSRTDQFPALGWSSRSRPTDGRLAPCGN